MKRRQQIPRDDEQLARYRYLIDVLPASILDNAHATAINQLTTEQRATVLGNAWAAIAGTEGGAASSDSSALAQLLQKVSESDSAPTKAAAAALAALIIASPPVTSYFATGAGSVDIDKHPPWAQDLAGHDGAPIDSATARRRALEYGEWFA